MVSFNPTRVEPKTVNLQVTSNDPDGFLLKGKIMLLSLPSTDRAPSGRPPLKTSRLFLVWDFC